MRDDEKDHNTCVITKLNACRLRQGISIAELARRTEINGKRLWHVINEQREMRVDEFLKLCIVLRVDPRSFVTREMVDDVAGATRRSIESSNDLSK